MTSSMPAIDWSLPAAEVLAELLTDVWVPTNAEVTISMIRDTIGLTTSQYALVRDTLENAIKALKASENRAERTQGLDLQDALAAMVSKGASLSELDRQATIDMLAVFGSWPDAVRDSVKALGGTWVKRWTLEGLTAEPTLSQIEFRQARDTAIASTEQMINDESTKLNTVREARRAAIDDPAKTGAEIVAATMEAFG